MQVIFGAYTLRPRERELTGPDGPIELSARSFDILAALIERPDALVAKTDLLDRVWPGVVVEENTLHVHMSALRKALGPGYIMTVHGRGYRYVGPVPRGDGLAPETRPPPQGNLHRYGVECVAREAEQAQVLALAGRHRLVTILGAGGVGKTTLAMATAAALAPRFAGGVFVIDLAPLSSGSLVESAVILTLNIPFRAQSAPLKSILDTLRDRQVLLVFDNCEHVAEAVAQLCAALLAEAPGVGLIATTQVPLGLAEEHIFRLAPFALTGDDAQAGLFLAYCYEALGERLAEGEAPAVARLCRRLDGVALALKMAAARAANLGIEAVDRQIAEQLEGLVAGWDASLARHRSLAASLNWSYDLLAERDRRTLRALGAFQGSFTLEGVRALAGPGADDSVAELVRRSLVVRDGPDRSRYRLLETMRHFAIERLAEADEEAAVRTAHAAFMATHFRRALDNWETLPDAAWLALHRGDGDNLRAALDWARVRGDWATFVALAARSYRYWIEAQLPDEGMAVCEVARSHAGEADPDEAALLHLALAELARIARQDLKAREVLETAIGHFSSSADIPRLAHALMLKGTVQLIQEQVAGATETLHRLDGLTSGMAASKLKARVLVAAAMHSLWSGEPELGRARYEAGLAMHRATGNQRGWFKSTMMLAEFLHGAGDTDGAVALVGRVLDDLRRDGTDEEIGVQLSNLAAYHLSTGDHRAGRACLDEAAARMPRSDRNAYWCLIQNAADLALQEGRPETAARLMGFVDNRFEQWADGRQSTEVMQKRRMLARLADSLPPERLAGLDREGRALGLFEAELLAGL